VTRCAMRLAIARAARATGTGWFHSLPRRPTTHSGPCMLVGSVDAADSKSSAAAGPRHDRVVGGDHGRRPPVVSGAGRGEAVERHIVVVGSRYTGRRG
jgi:hypothetical protein